MKKILILIMMALSTAAFALEDKIQVENKTNLVVEMRVEVKSPKDKHAPFVSEVKAEPGYNEFNQRFNYTKNDEILIKFLSSNKGFVTGKVFWDGEDVHVVLDYAKVTLLKTKAGSKWTTEKVALEDLDQYEVKELTLDDGTYRHYELACESGRMKIVTNDPEAIAILSLQ